MMLEYLSSGGFGVIYKIKKISTSEIFIIKTEEKK